jgi:hypothetical protein
MANGDDFTWKVISDEGAQQYARMDPKGYELLTRIGTPNNDRYHVTSFRVLEFLGDIFIRMRANFKDQEPSLWRVHPECTDVFDHWYIAHKITSPTGKLKTLFEPIAREARMVACEDVDMPDYPFDEIQTLMVVREEGKLTIKVLLEEDMVKLEGETISKSKTKYCWMKYVD